MRSACLYVCGMKTASERDAWESISAAMQRESQTTTLVKVLTLNFDLGSETCTCTGHDK